jgi:hypothetical protein
MYPRESKTIRDTRLPRAESTNERKLLRRKAPLSFILWQLTQSLGLGEAVYPLSSLSILYRYLQLSRNILPLSPALIRLVPNQVGVRQWHLLATQLMTPSYDTTNTFSKMGMLPFWCVGFGLDRLHTKVTWFINLQVDGTLYCLHRYFFSRDSVYFSTRFDQLGIRDHEALPVAISLSDIECKDFDAFLSILYPECVFGPLFIAVLI